MVLRIGIKEGQAERLKEWTRAFVKTVAEKEPQFVALTVFFNEEETEMTSIQVHRDTASMDHHMEVLGPAMAELAETHGNWFEYVEPPATNAYFGPPSERALEEDRDYAEQGLVTLSLFPVHVAGFVRSAPLASVTEAGV